MIIGLVDGGVYIGADGYGHGAKISPKVFRIGEFLIGSDDDFVRYIFNPPECRGDVDVCMATRLVSALHGYEGRFLVGYRDRLFVVDGGKAEELVRGIVAMGEGAEYALGALGALAMWGEGMSLMEMVEGALVIAGGCSDGVKEPYIVERL